MNDTMSLLLATGILAVGGLGLFMYKNNSDDNDSDSNNDDKNSLFDFDLRSFFGNSDKDDEDKNEYDDNYDTESEPEFYEPPKRTRGSKTKCNRKNVGTKRRY